MASLVGRTAGGRSSRPRGFDSRWLPRRPKILETRSQRAARRLAVGDPEAESLWSPVMTRTHPGICRGAIHRSKRVESVSSTTFGMKWHDQLACSKCPALHPVVKREAVRGSVRSPRSLGGDFNGCTTFARDQDFECRQVPPFTSLTPGNADMADESRASSWRIAHWPACSCHRVR